METITIGRWTLEVDREATEAAFSKISLGSPETCECDYCKNLVVARDSAYPEDARQVFSQLGIDYRKEAVRHGSGTGLDRSCTAMEASFIS